MVYTSGNNSLRRNANNKMTTSKSFDHSYIPLTVLEQKSWSKKSENSKFSNDSDEPFYDVPRKTHCVRKNSCDSSYCRNYNRGIRRHTLARVHYKDPEIHEYARIPGGSLLIISKKKKK